jgi:DNA-binding Lrp family transcriptional regulator
MPIAEGSTEELRKICESKRIPEKDIAIFLKLNESKLMEGLYIKWEEDGIVKGRYKYVRPNFVQTILSYGKHWLDRPSIPNRMKEGCSMFELN